jgi:hypothetical protein
MLFGRAGRKPFDMRAAYASVSEGEQAGVCVYSSSERLKSSYRMTPRLNTSTLSLYGSPR